MSYYVGELGILNLNPNTASQRFKVKTTCGSIEVLCENTWESAVGVFRLDLEDDDMNNFKKSVLYVDFLHNAKNVITKCSVIKCEDEETKNKLENFFSNYDDSENFAFSLMVESNATAAGFLFLLDHDEFVSIIKAPFAVYELDEEWDTQKLLWVQHD